MVNMLMVAFVSLLALQRLWEFFISERHRKILLQQGGREHNPKHFVLMFLLHSLWLVAIVAEVLIIRPTLNEALSVIFLFTFGLGQLLRILAMRQLKHRWTARIITVPNADTITGGIFRYMRHPNYTGVIIEIAAAPLIFNAVYTATIFSILNLILLRYRIAKEEQALNTDNNYFEAFEATNQRR